MLNVHQIRGLKGAPLSVLCVMMLAGQPVSQGFCARHTGYSINTCNQALLMLAEMGLATRNGRYAWQYSGGPAQLPFVIPEEEERMTRNGCESCGTTTATTAIVDESLRSAAAVKDSQPLRVKRNLNALKSAGICGKKAREVAALEHVSPAYIKAHQAYADLRGDSTGLLIRRMLDGDPAPKPPPDARDESRRYIEGKYAAFIEH